MIYFFQLDTKKYFLVETEKKLNYKDRKKLSWLFDDAKIINSYQLDGKFIGPRKEMITPWSTNAVEITQNMGISGILRIEEVLSSNIDNQKFDPMLQQIYDGIDQDIFSIAQTPEPIVFIENISLYNDNEGLALSDEEVDYLESISDSIGRKLTDSEIYGFAQINSEHCRHKIFNGTFIIDGKEMKDSLFALIKKTSSKNPNNLVSAYKDNVAFIVGPKVEQFAPINQDKSEYFELTDINTVISLKAETHNFPTTVEPFNGAATGSGGEIRDRLAGGKGSLPLAGTAVYMTSYPRNSEDHPWEKNIEARNWLYQTPEEILIKASNGASDFGNKYGQPLINGSLLTFEHQEKNKKYGYDKVIMQAGGIGFAKAEDAKKDIPEAGDIIVVLGGDNYRIGMGGGAVSSVATGEFGNNIELNAVQRANPEMQKRVSNVIRSMVEANKNPIVSIHDHGAGGHLNSLSELVEDTGARININNLPLGDLTLSFKEILGNESQERMGLVIKEKDYPSLEKISQRERAPIYKVGEVTGDMRFIVESDENDICPIDLKLEYMFGKPPKTVLKDKTHKSNFSKIEYTKNKLNSYIENVLKIEAVACKDWLTNKVDRSVTGKVAMQQCTGPLQLPLNNLGVVALDFQGKSGVATALGHAPLSGLINPEAGSRLAIAESLTNIIWAPLLNNIEGISLSANWMWPAKNQGENSRLYNAVEAVSEFVIKLGVNIPTGKDSLSMTQKYPNGDVVFAPGTAIISAVGEVTDITKVISPIVITESGTKLIYINFSNSPYELGGSSFAQTINKIGTKSPDVLNPKYFAKAFNSIQTLLADNKILSGHDISAGGMITTLLEMNFANSDYGMRINLSGIEEKDIVKLLLSENPGIIIQVKNNNDVTSILEKQDIKFHLIGQVIPDRKILLVHNSNEYVFDIDRLRKTWYQTSYNLDKKQSGEGHAHCRFNNFSKQDLHYNFNISFTGKASDYGINMSRRTSTGIKAAIIREKGVNGDREMAYAMHLAGFDVKDIHMTDMISGKEDLTDVNFIVFVGGFSNSDVLGSAKGWAGAFLYNKKAKKALDNYYAREDTLSLGVCNGCQLMSELGLIYPKHPEKPRLLHNDSGKFESGFINININENNSIMLKSLSGNRLGAWVAHGEGKFSFPYYHDNYNRAITYSYDVYPGNPNGSDWDTAAIYSNNGRHLAMMPHLERAFLPWQWPNYPKDRKDDEVTPWIEAFVNARKWVEDKVN